LWQRIKLRRSHQWIDQRVIAEVGTSVKEGVLPLSRQWFGRPMTPGTALHDGVSMAYLGESM